MTLKTLKFAAALLAITAVSAFSQPSQLLYPSPLPYVSTPWPDFPYDSVLVKTWEGIKQRNISAYTTGAVHRPKSDDPGDAVSEGIGYGMFLALYCNDQRAFDSMLDAAERFMWVPPNSSWNGGGYYDWRINRDGSRRTGTGPASDADQDIALLLIFAERLVQEGARGWTSTTRSGVNGAWYGQRAKVLLNTIRTGMIERNYLLPGFWGDSRTGADVKNPGYFAPAFYRIFAEYEPNHAAAWNALVEGSYDLIRKSPGYARGLLPDWCTMDGGSTGGAGYNAYFRGDAQYRDAIRVYWRLANDYLWYGEPRAKTFLDNAIKFLENLGGVEHSNFYDMSGNLVPATDGERLRGTNPAATNPRPIPRQRREHSHLTVGMWAAAAMGSDVELGKVYSDYLLNNFYAPGRNFFGKVNIPTETLPMLTFERVVSQNPLQIARDTLRNVTFAEDTLHNEMYFDQFLAWFGASILAGNFTNVWEDLKDGIPTGPPNWVRPPSFTPQSRDIDASVAPLVVTALFDRPVRWTAVFTHDLTGESVTIRAGSASDSVNFTWYGLSENGAYMPQGMYTMVISAAGFTSSPEKLWLGRPYAPPQQNLRTGNRLLIDDFAHGKFPTPYIGVQWRSYPANSNATLSLNNTGTEEWLSWAYTLNQNFGGYFYSALEWNCGNLDLTGIDTLIFTARGAGSLGVSVQLISGDMGSGHHFFEDSVSLSSTRQTFRRPISNFKQRLGGSGKSLTATLSTMLGIRFQVQDDRGGGATGSIMLESVYLAGSDAALSRLYTYNYVEPPPYIAPDGPIRAANRNPVQAEKFSLRRSGPNVHLTVPANMAGADARIVNVKGVVVRRAKVPQSGKMQISTKELASGVYFIEVRKAGMASFRAPLGNVR